MSRARSCQCPPGRCKPQIREDRKGAPIAIVCNACVRFLSQRCRVCLRDYRDLPLHQAKSECGRFDRAGMWWTTDRPPNAGSPPRSEPSNLSLWR